MPPAIRRYTSRNPSGAPDFTERTRSSNIRCWRMGNGSAAPCSDCFLSSPAKRVTWRCCARYWWLRPPAAAVARLIDRSERPSHPAKPHGMSRLGPAYNRSTGEYLPNHGCLCRSVSSITLKQGPERRNTSMATPDTLRYTRIPLAEGPDQRTPSGPAVIAPHQRAGHMTAPDHFAKAELNILRRRGPSTYEL